MRRGRLGILLALLALAAPAARACGDAPPAADCCPLMSALHGAGSHCPASGGPAMDCCSARPGGETLATAAEAARPSPTPTALAAPALPTVLPAPPSRRAAGEIAAQLHPPALYALFSNWLL